MGGGEECGVQQSDHVSGAYGMRSWWNDDVDEIHVASRMRK
jgi:hypothetical protein